MKKPNSLTKVIMALKNEKRKLLQKESQNLKIKATNSNELNIKSLSQYSKQIFANIEEINNYIDLLNTDLESDIQKNQIFMDFANLSLVCEIANLNNREKKELIFYFIEKNLRVNLIGNISTLFSDSPFFKKLTELNDPKIDELNSNHNLNLFLASETSELPIELQSIHQQLLELLNASDKEFYNFLNSYKVLKHCYFEKLPNITKEDIKEIKTALYILGVYADIIFAIEDDLNNESKKEPKPIELYLKKNGRILLNRFLFQDFKEFSTRLNFQILGALYTLDKWHSNGKSKSKIILLHFLNDTLEVVDISNKDKAEFILYIIDQNLKGNNIDYELDNGILLEFNDNENDIEIPTLDYKTLLKLFKNNINYLVFNTIKDLNLDNIKNNYQILKENYVLKKDNLTPKDINVIRMALLNLGLNEENANIVKDYLLTKVKEVKIIETSTINNKERSKIEHELSSYLDIYTLKPIRYLDDDELLETLTLLKKLNYSNKIIYDFITAVYKFNRFSSISPIDEFLNLYNKITYYSEFIPELSDILIDLDNACNELAETNQDEEFYQEYVLEGLKKASVLMPTCYSYEMNKIRKK